MDDLIAFLRAREDERQAHAEKDLWALDRATNGGDWKARYGYNLPTSLIVADGVQVAITVASVDGLADGEENQHAKDAFLIARMVKAARQRANDVLGDVAAKREIIHQLVDTYAERRGDDEAAEWHKVGHDYARLKVLRLLALPYADHPDYREEWRP
jgi:hypothetical protein